MKASTKACGGVVSLAVVSIGLMQADLQGRQFEDKFGRVIEAELVSHTGADSETVRIDRGGKTFEVKLDLFSAKDRAFIREWMANTPPQIDYAFRVEVERKAADDLTADAAGTQGTGSRGERRIGGFGRGGRTESVSNAFDVKITSLTRHPIADLKVECRSYMIDHPGAFGRDFAFGRAGDRTKREAKLEFVEDSVEIEGPLKYNGEISFTTKAVRLDELRGSSDDYQDELLGVVVRIVDKQGEVVFEHRDKRTKEIAWEKEEAEADGSERDLFDW